MGTEIQQWIASLLVLAGAFFALIASLGIVRMPDLYCRMHAATKAGAFGLALMLLGLVVAAPTLRIVIQAGLIIIFFYLTAPVAAQVIGRSAVQRGIPLWKAPSNPDSKEPVKAGEADADR